MSLTPSWVPPNHTHARSPFGSHARLAAWHCTVGVGRYAVWPPPSRGRSTPSVGSTSADALETLTTLPAPP